MGKKNLTVAEGAKEFVQKCIFERLTVNDALGFYFSPVYNNVTFIVYADSDVTEAAIPKPLYSWVVATLKTTSGVDPNVHNCEQQGTCEYTEGHEERVLILTFTPTPNGEAVNAEIVRRK